MRCLNCKSEIRDDSVFCEYCGLKVGEVQPEKETFVPEGDHVYCEHCGTAISKEAYICPKCGQLTHNGKTNKNVYDVDEPNVGLNIVAFLIPIIGFIMWVAMKGKTPNKAKQIGISALIGFGINLVIQFWL